MRRKYEGVGGNAAELKTVRILENPDFESLLSKYHYELPAQLNFRVETSGDKEPTEAALAGHEKKQGSQRLAHA